MRILLKSILLTFFVGFAQSPTNAIIAFHPKAATEVKSPKQAKKVKMLKLLRELKALKKYSPQPRTKTEKIILYTFLVIGIVAFVYFLQGTIWLTIVGLLAFLGIRMGKKQRERETSHYVYINDKGEEVALAQNTQKTSKISYGKSYATRSVKSFLRGLGLLALGVILSALFSEIFFEVGILILLLFAALLGGLIFMAFAFGQSVKSISNKEPEKDKAVLMLILSLLFLLPLVIIFLGGLISLLSF
jgi:accessory gene regulator protein AgrB